MQRLAKPLTHLMILALTPALTGCVALNIPSQRFHDPSDQGGLLGHWKGVGKHGHDVHEGHVGADGVVVHSEFPGAVDPFCLDGGPLVEDPFDPYCESQAKKPPEVPWPRFHPVPTRPVFGSTTP